LIDARGKLYFTAICGIPLKSAGTYICNGTDEALLNIRTESARAVIAREIKRMRRIVFRTLSCISGLADEWAVWVEIFMSGFFKGSDELLRVPTGC
jgi:hypothetical protein